MCLRHPQSLVEKNTTRPLPTHVTATRHLAATALLILLSGCTAVTTTALVAGAAVGVATTAAGVAVDGAKLAGKGVIKAGKMVTGGDSDSDKDAETDENK